MARPRKIVDYAKLDGLCQIQCTGEEAASVLGMSYELLNQKLKAEKGMGFLDYFAEKRGAGKASLRRRQFEMAKTNPTMAIWLGKQYLGQSDKADVKLGGDAENPLTIQQVKRVIVDART